MSGFFKKLFNRITGKKDETPPLPAPEIEALPAPEPVPDAPEQSVELPSPLWGGTEGGGPRVEPPPAPVVEALLAPKPVEFAPEQFFQPPSPLRGGTEGGGPRVEPPPTPTPTPPHKGEGLELPAKPKPRKTSAKTPQPKPKSKPGPKKAEARTVEPPVLQRLEPVPEPEPVAIAPAPVPLPPSRGWLSRLKDGMAKSSRSITGSITSIFTKRKLDTDTLQDLEDVLLQADLGLPMAERIVKAVSTGRYDKEIDPEEVKRILATEVSKVLKPVEVPFNFGAEKPFIILVVGVNGAGKTTTIGKLGAIAAREGYKVMFAACDTFRAAAIEQLTVWGQRAGARTMSRPTGADASGLAFDAMKEAKEDGTDILFIDTAGRLQNKQYLMDELDKIVRVIKKQDETAPHAVLLVLDATTGQNAVAQADIFTKVAGVTGLIMTKLDGTARGGILVAIAEKFKLPVHAIGVGETIDDLQPFDADAFARAIAGLEDP